MTSLVLAIQAERTPAINTGAVQATPTVDATAVTQDKLKQDDEKARRDNLFPWTYLNTSSVGTILVGFVGLLSFITWFRNRQDEQKKQREDRNLERERRQEEQKRWLDDREAERQKRAEERFQDVVEGLGGDKEEARVAAAIMLRTFAHKDYEKFCGQAFDLACIYLQNRPKDQNTPAQLDPFSQALVTVFRESFPLALESLKKSLNKEGTILTYAEILPLVSNAAGIQLDHAYLSHADLAEVQLREAYLREAILYRAKLTNAGLKRAKLRDANLSKATLTDADLTGADLTKANLTEANPEAAAWLEGTKMNGVTGLKPEQREKCIQKGAIFDDIEQAPASATNSPASPPPAQSNDAQAPSAPTFQESTQTPGVDGSRTTLPSQSSS